MRFPEPLMAKLTGAKVAAGVSIERVEHALAVVQALLDGGITVIELTLRTPVAFDALRIITQGLPEVTVGVGTILTPEQVRQVSDAGADFGVSPGLNPRVVKAANECGFPFAPGIATPSELEQAIEFGCRFVKFFPAEPIGGLRYLRSMTAPYRHLGVKYFPLGGINPGNMLDYLGQADVPLVGGSWIVKPEYVACEQWEMITASARDVCSKLNGENKGCD